MYGCSSSSPSTSSQLSCIRGCTGGAYAAGGTVDPAAPDRRRLEVDIRAANL